MNVTPPKDGNHRFSKKNRFNMNKSRFHKLNDHAQRINVPEDRDSIVSSNTTSIMTDDAFDYNGGITSNTKDANSDIDENNDIIKEGNSNKKDTGDNPFYSGPNISQRYTQFRKREFKPILSKNETVRCTSDEDSIRSDEDDNTENELHFTPRIKEPSILRSSLLEQRNGLQARSTVLKEPQAKLNPTVNNRNSSKRKSSAVLRKQLGKPLPLPYLNSSNISNTPTLQRREEAFTDEVVQKKRELIESKWHRLLLHDKKMVEKKLESLREYERKRISSQGNDVSSSQQDNSFKVSTPTKSYVSLEQTSIPNISDIKTPNNILGKERRETNNNTLNFQGQGDPIQRLQSEIEMHTEKLDTIIRLLKNDTSTSEVNKSTSNGDIGPGQINGERWWKSMMMICKKSGNTLRKYREYFLWTFCIFILLYCNIYVYYKL